MGDSGLRRCGGVSLECCQCKSRTSPWWCLDCHGRPHYCDKCLYTNHIFNLFHRIEIFTGFYYKTSALHQVNVFLWLGHNGQQCSCYGEAPETSFQFSKGQSSTLMGFHFREKEISHPDFNQALFDKETYSSASGGLDFNEFKPPIGVDSEGNPWITVVYTNGVHYLRAKFCGCVKAPSRHIQFLDASLYPATKKKPRTVFTFHVLDDFYLENLECKTAARNYYSKLRRLTSSVFPHLVPVSALSLRIFDNSDWTGI